MRTLMALALAALPLRVAFCQGDEFVTRGIVTDLSGKRLEGKIVLPDGSFIFTDSLGEFRLVRSSGDILLITAQAIGYVQRQVILRPGRDSVVRVVLVAEDFRYSDGITVEPIRPRTLDSLSIRDGVAMGFTRLPGGGSLLLALASKKTFSCEPRLEVAQAQESKTLFLYVTYVLTKTACSGTAGRAMWETSFPEMSGPTEIVVAVDGVVDRFRLRDGGKRLCVAAESVPGGTSLIAGPYPQKESPAQQNTLSLEMLLFPRERLPAC